MSGRVLCAGLTWERVVIKTCVGKQSDTQNGGVLIKRCIGMAMAYSESDADSNSREEMIAIQTATRVRR